MAANERTEARKVGYLLLHETVNCTIEKNISKDQVQIKTNEKRNVHNQVKGKAGLCVLFLAQHIFKAGDKESLAQKRAQKRRQGRGSFVLRIPEGVGTD